LLLIQAVASWKSAGMLRPCLNKKVFVTQPN